VRLPTRYSRLAGAAAGAAGLMILASGCASGAPHQASGTGARPQQTTATVAPSPPAPTPSATRRPVPAASPATGSTSPAYTGPHFTTPQAAMTYLAAAYNSDDATAMHAVTDAQAFTSLQAMRYSEVDLQFVSCTPRQQGDYVCTVRYSLGSSSNSEHRAAMLIAAPALNPGWYMYRFISGCD
jgi:hypothetical protein